MRNDPGEPAQPGPPETAPQFTEAFYNDEASADIQQGLFGSLSFADQQNSDAAGANNLDVEYLY